MKLRPVAKPDNRNKTTSKKVDMTSSHVGKLSRHCHFLEQSGGRISDTDSAKVTFSVIVTLSLTKTENRTKRSLTQLSHYCFE